MDAASKGGEQVEQAAREQAEDLSPVEFRKALGSGAILLDVRTPGEVAQGRIVNSRNVDWNGPDRAKAFAELDPYQPVLLYCQAGGRSRQALEYLKSKGFKDVRHLEGGFSAWQRAGYPIEQQGTRE